MVLTKQYMEDWEEWHDLRMRELNQPYGILSVISQDWLAPGEFFVSPHAPGRWLLEDGEIYHYPSSGDEPGESAPVLIAGEPAVGERVHIPHGHNRKIGTGSGVPVFYGDLEIETVTRVDSRGFSIYALRVRDPQRARLGNVEKVETFALQERWIVPAVFTRAETLVHDVPTVEEGLYETAFTVGTLSVQIDGTSYTLDVSGHRGGSRLGGYFVDDVRVHFGDPTNGKESYGGGRVVKLPGLEELLTITDLDFNRSISLPCAFSPYVACASAPPQNRLPIPVSAGEKAPPGEHERIKTYHG